uniref:Cytochrome P450 52A3-A n=1 Tax=Candida maltosa TaxID=5479 RepID=CP52C_CANMA|nr:RecName: Full=Cytochrome P450 52A3-A; Short=CYP52A3-A; AltName: Full=Alkane-inducible P450-ALK1-A; AltName: Full=CYPLIIA3; AltName: Full=Cytochrome P-450ALK; AltName: Full=Cytochrome P450-CM1 [Candida maltosa]BAA00371.1 cytochrome P-450alk [Candida maltosa]prf//1513184A cytochrome P450alk [Candida maltosa]
MAIEQIIEEVLPYLTKWYTILFGAAVTYFLSIALRNKFYEYKLKCENPVYFEDAGLFGIPALIDIIKVRKAGQLADYTDTTFDKYPNLSSYMTVAGVLKIVFTVDPENIKAVLATQFNDFALGARHAHFDPLLGDGIFTLDGEGWKLSRAMLRPQFAREQIAHVKALEPHVQILAKQIKLNKGKTFDLQELFFRFTVDTATEFLFGESVHSLYDEKLGIPAPNDIPGRENFAEAFNTSQHYLATRTYSQIFYWLTNPKEFRDCNAKVHKLAQYFVNTALNATEKEVEEKSKGGYVFLYELVKQTRDPKVLQDQLLNIMVAGRDTTAGLLSFAMFELARNPKIWNKLREEVEVNFGLGDEARVDEISFETLKKCEYLKAVLNETLRMYPSVPINFRTATRDTTLPRGGGKDGNSPIFVPKGSSVVYSVYKTHRLKQFYGEDAYEFRPERWFEPSTRKLGWAYLPFNGGPRICLGQQFALTEASYVIARLAQMFEHLESKDETYPPNKCIHLTMNHNEGVFISAK